MESGALSKNTLTIGFILSTLGFSYLSWKA